MADIAISYSHRDIDFVRFIEARAKAAGRSVWLDDPSERSDNGAGLTLPSGQNHWEVISREFVNATAVVILRTPNWNASEYCRRERELVDEWGKWTVEVAPDGIAAFDGLLAVFDEYSPVADAHARLVDGARHGGVAQKSSITERWLAGSEASDAQRVINAAPEVPWRLITPALDPYLRGALERRESSRRRLRRTGIVSVAVLSVLAVLSAVTWAIAVFAQRSAQADADRSRSIALAVRADTEPDTLKAVRLAGEAVALHADSRSTAALAVAEGRDQRLRTGSIRPGAHIDLVLAPKGLRAAAVGTDEISVFDRTDGSAIATFADTTGPRFGALHFTPDGEKMVYIRGNRSLVLRNIDGGEPETLATDVQSVAADGDRIWWSTGNTLISSDFDGGNRTTSPLDRPLSTLSIDSPKRLADGIDSAGQLVTFTLDDGRAAVRSTTKVGSGDKEFVPGARLNPVVKRCGDSVFGVVQDYRLKMRGTRFIVDQTGVLREKSTAAAVAPVCYGDGDALVTDIYGSPVKSFRGGPVPVFQDASEIESTTQSRYAIAGEEGGRIYAITPEGRLYSLDPSAAVTEYPTTPVLAFATLGDEEYGFDEAGSLIRLSDGAMVAIGIGSANPNLFAANKSGVAILTDLGPLIVDATMEQHRVEVTGDVANMHSLTSAGDGNGFVLGYNDHVDVLTAAGGVENTHRFPWLDEDDAVVAAALSPDRTQLAVATYDGRLAVIREGGDPAFLADGIGPGTAKDIAFTGNDKLVAAAPDGRVLQIEVAGGGAPTVQRSVIFGAPVVALRVSGDRVLAAGLGAASVVYRVDDLGMAARVDASTVSAYSAQLNEPDGESTTELTGLSRSGRLVRIPLKI